MEGYRVKRAVMNRLEPGADLLEEITKLVTREGITLGVVSGIGALHKAAVGIFLPAAKEYKINRLDMELEICSLTGNVSLKEGAPFVHAHLALSDKEGRGYGGHLFPGCEIFVAEVVIIEFEGPPLERAPRAECGGLALWAVENVGTE